MNMIFNKSDLVGYESVDRTEAKRKALAKIVAAWESKQARNATRFGGLGLLAVSLAACNTSSDDTAATPAATPAATTPTVTALSTALTTSSDIVTSTFTSADDSVTGIGGATGRTFGTGDVLVDNSTTDNDTLTITTADGSTQAPSTVTGIENIIYNNTSLSDASAVNLQNITGAKVTVNHTGNAAVVDNTSAVTNIGSNMTVTYGTNVTGASSAGLAAGAKNVVLNAGAAELTVTTAGTADGITINGGTSAAMSVTLTSTDKNATIVGGSTTPGNTNTQTVDAAGVAGVSFTSGALAGNSATGDVNTVVFSNVVSGTLTVGRTSGTTEATGTNVNIDGAETASDAVTLKAAGHIDLDIRGGGNEQIEALTVEGNGAAATLHFDAADAPTTLTMTGSQSITAVLAAAQADAITTITDSTTAGTTTIQIADPIPGNAGHDYSTLAVDVIEFGGTATDTNNNTLVFANNATVKFGGTAAHTTIGTLDVTDGSATTTLADGAINLDFSQDATGALTIEGTADVLTTVNVTANAAQTSMSILGGSGVTINLSGSNNVTTTDSTGKALNAASLTGNLTATASANLLSITGGSGDDTFTGITAQKMVIDGGSGNDKLITTDADTYYTATISGIEVIDISNTAAGAADTGAFFKGSQMNGASFIIDSGSSDGTNDDFLRIDTANSVLAMDSSTINLSGLQFGNDNIPVVVNMGTLNTAAFTTAVTFNITGTSQIDTITGYDNADTIAGGAGNDTIAGGGGADDLSGDAGIDTITGGAGADKIDGGAGADLITGGTGIDTMTGGAGADDFIFSNTGADFTAANATALAAAADKITDFAASTTATAFDGDEIDIGAATGAIVTAATAAAAGTAQVATAGALAVFHADDDTLAEKITAVENALTAGMGQSIHFMDSGNTYIFISDADNTVDAGDALIELTGFDSTGKALVAQAGDLFIA